MKVSSVTKKIIDVCVPRHLNEVKSYKNLSTYVLRKFRPAGAAKWLQAHDIVESEHPIVCQENPQFEFPK